MTTQPPPTAPDPSGVPNAERDSLLASLDALEQRMDELRASSELDHRELSDALLNMEERVAVLRRGVELQTGEDAEVASRANLRHWRQALAQLEIDTEAGRVHDLIGRRMDAEARAWSRLSPESFEADPDEAANQRLEALHATSSLAHARIAHLGPAAVEEDPLAGARSELRAALGPESLSPADRARHGTWLLDESANVLSGLDEVPAEVGCLHLEQAREELQWTLRTLPPPRRRLRGRLAWRLRRVRAEIEERRLQEVLELRFGTTWVARLERTILALIFGVLGLLLVEVLFDVPAKLRPWLIGLETAACAVFLAEFTLKLALVPEGRMRWLRRHFLVDFVPSIPFGLIASLDANPAQAGRIARLLRLPRIVRYVRVLLPVLRMFRVVAFMARGMDRVARAHRATMNRDVVITPNREERARARARGADPGARLERLEASLHRTWLDVLREAPEEEREGLAATRTGRLQDSWREPDRTPSLRGQAATFSGPRIERTAEEILTALQEAEATMLARFLGADTVARFARFLRIVAHRPLRWLPIGRRLVPDSVHGLPDDELVAASARRLGHELARHHGRMYWFADLHGTITPSEMVDRAGTALVKSSIRPATRLLLFGGAYLLVVGLLELVPSTVPVAGEIQAEPSLVMGAIQGVVNFLERFVGTTLVVLGSICLAILAIGSWLKRLAQDATAFFEQAASAQFLSLTEAIRNRTMDRDVTWLDARVVQPEASLEKATTFDDEARRAAFSETVQAWLVRADARTSGIDHEPTRAALERAVLLYRDALNGALLGESDTRATSQLLGNPALIQLREQSTRSDKREQKDLATLDLERGSGLRGPYLWFSLVSRSVARSAARLIVEYNRSALPLDELERVQPEERERYEAWLASHPANSGPGPYVRETRAPSAASYRTSAFTALHFLDDDPSRNAAVEAHFGPEVRRLMSEDRRLLFCRIFGTYPLHLRAKNERFLNVARLYDEWLSGGRVFFLPLRMMGLSLAGMGRLVQTVARAAREIRDPRLRTRIDPKKGADFETAVRKIDRMRGPGVRAALWMRARFDPEYLGLELPGRPTPSASVASVDEDLDFLDADVRLREDIAHERERTRADLRRLARLLQDGLQTELEERLGAPFSPTIYRALAFAYCADLESVRSLYSTEIALAEALGGEPRDGVRIKKLTFARKLRKALVTWQDSRAADRHLPLRQAWRAVQENRWGARHLLETWARYQEEGGIRARQEEGLTRLVDLLRHPGRISEQLVNLRAVQSLALLDLLHYREHVWRLTGFQARGDEPGRLLDLGRPTQE